MYCSHIRSRLGPIGVGYVRVYCTCIVCYASARHLAACVMEPLLGCVCDLVSPSITDPVVYACVGDRLPYVERAGKYMCVCVCVCLEPTVS